ncbi:MAG: porin [Neptuniibacter sp.]
MKKSLIALAVAGAMVAPMVAQADATLYGSFRMGVAQTDGASTDGDLDVIDTSSRMGIKGDVDLGMEGSKGFFHWEAQVYGTDDADQGQALGNRLMYIGAKGDWGTAQIGKMYHPHYLLIEAPTNVFHPGSSGFGERFNLGNTFHKRQQNTVAYISPNMNGLTVIAGFVLLGDTDDNDMVLDDDVDGFNVAATYSGIENLTLSVSHGDVDAGNVKTAAAISVSDAGVISSTAASTVTDYSKEVTGVSAKYKAGAVEVMAKYETAEVDGNGANITDEDVWELAARYTTEGGVAVYGRYADYEEDNSSADLEQFGVGVSKKMGKGIVYLEHVNNDSNDSNGDRTVAGYRVDF